jgi:hypothetical protein
VAVIPDSCLVLHLGNCRAHFFLEVDRATMRNSCWGKRVRAYLCDIQSGKHAKRYPTRSLRILTVAMTAQRLQNLKETTHKVGGGDLFWFSTLAELSEFSVFFRPIWRLANDERDSVRKTLLG